MKKIILYIIQYCYLVIFFVTVNVNYAQAQSVRSDFFQPRVYKEPISYNVLHQMPESIEEVSLGCYKTYFPKGYGRNDLHTGIWNAIPFVVFNQDTLDVRFGMIFEHRQVGMLPENWIMTSMTAQNLPDLIFEIPQSKTFLDFTQGLAQWRATVVLTPEQIKILKLYTINNSIPSVDKGITVFHQFIDGTSRPYLLGSSLKKYFYLIIQLYEKMAALPNAKIVSCIKEDQAVGFFDDIVMEGEIEYVSEPLPVVQEVEIVESQPPARIKKSKNKSVKQSSPIENSYNYDDLGEYQYYNEENEYR